MTRPTRLEIERAYHADLAYWWLIRALYPDAGRIEGLEAGHHASMAAHYDRLQRCWYRKVVL